jgi:hypothetical protein
VLFVGVLLEVPQKKEKAWTGLNTAIRIVII